MAQNGGSGPGQENDVGEAGPKVDPEGQGGSRSRAVPGSERLPREAVRRMVREEKRNRVRAEVLALVKNQKDVQLARKLANADVDSFSKRWSKADRGQL